MGASDRVSTLEKHAVQAAHSVIMISLMHEDARAAEQARLRSVNRVPSKSLRSMSQPGLILAVFVVVIVVKVEDMAMLDTGLDMWCD